MSYKTIKKCAKILYSIALFFIFIIPIYAVTNKVVTKDRVAFSDSTKAIIVDRASPEFKIILQSNATTGYSWHLKHYDRDLIKVVKHKYHLSEGRKLVGAPGYEEWTFKAEPEAFTVSHITDITLIYLRPWNGIGDKVTNFRVVTRKYAN